MIWNGRPARTPIEDETPRIRNFLAPTYNGTVGGTMATKGWFYDDLAQSEQVIDRFLDRLGQQTRIRFENSSLEDDKKGIDRWMIHPDGRKIALEIKTIERSASPEWQNEINFELSHNGGRIGWSFDKNKESEMFLWIWNTQPLSVLWMTKQRFDQIRDLATTHGLFHKMTINKTDSVGYKGRTLWLHRDVLWILENVGCEAAKIKAMELSSSVPDRKWVKPRPEPAEILEILESLT
jgi:hypothetical protein